MSSSKPTGKRGGRRKARELTLQALYQCDLGESGVHNAVVQLSEDPKAKNADLDYFKKIAHGIMEQLEALDERIGKASQNWSLDRVSVIDRNILRLGVFELVACPEAPLKVVINEAIELCKRFGGQESRKFVNGVLDRVAKDVRAKEINRS